MPTEPVLIAGEWCSEPNAGSFSATNPKTREAGSLRYPVSGRATLERALAAATLAAGELARTPPEAIARFLELCAEGIEARAEALVALAHTETALPREPRLGHIELPRTTGQLRQATRAVRTRAWCQPVLDLELDIRSMFAPLEAPVFVLGPNNFPLAFNAVMGGDFAAAIAAQNPVIAKAHPNHPGTTRLLAEIARHALEAAGLPTSTLQMFYDVDPELGLELAADPRVGATAFTGSRRAGLALKAAADRAGRPIYLELGSINPVFVLPGALRERGPEIAQELFASCSLAAGQFCTNPGLSVLIDGPGTRQFLEGLQRHFESEPSGSLFSAAGAAHLSASVNTLVGAGARLVCGGHERADGGFGFDNTLLLTTGAQFLENRAALQTEAFGAVHLVVVVDDLDQMREVARALEGSLTGSVYSDRGGSDDAAYGELAPALAPRVGRLLNDKMPTGVAVSPAMHHGGPYPATGHPGFTSVGLPASIQRFAVRRCYDGVRQHRLPPELENHNPTGCWRSVDGAWTNQGV